MSVATASVARLSGISFWYPDAARPALRDVDLELRAGELLIVCGPSGSGKTTLLRLIQGIVPQLSGGDLAGFVTVLDRDPTATRPHALAAAGVTLLYQNPVEGFVAHRVADEVAFGPENLELAPEAVEARVRESLRDVALPDAAGRSLSSLSGGEQQRTALAAALALRPRLLLLDEPSAHLDERTAGLVLALVDRLRREHAMTVVLAEHRLGQAASRADRIAVLVDGALRGVGPPREVLADPTLAALGVPVPRATQAALRLGLGRPLPLTPDELAARLSDRRPRAPHRPPTPTLGDVALRFASVRARYPGASGDALSDVSFTIRRGERVALVGPSGAGKTTCARLALGLLRPSGGVVEVLGLRDTATAALARRVGLVVQNPMHQLFAESVEDEIALGFQDQERSAARQIVEHELARFGLVELRRRHPLSLSEGERRRVALAAVIARGPELLVLDEPTLAQDETQRDVLAELVRELSIAGTTVVAITHDREFVNDACERVLALETGRLAADLPLRGDRAALEDLARADIPVGDVPATMLRLTSDWAAWTVADLVAVAG